MLNITSRISFSKSSKRFIRKFYKKNGKSFDSDSWSDINKKVKNDASKKLLLNQRLKCVYCERYLLALGHEIDHFAHKANYPEFSFIAVNLFYACSFCNGDVKKQKNTISQSNIRYNLCTFKLVHPFFDNPNIEIRFLDPDRVYLDWNNSSLRGKITIQELEYDQTIMTNIRSRQLIWERLNPFTTAQENILIQEAIAYK